MVTYDDTLYSNLWRVLCVFFFWGWVYTDRDRASSNDHLRPHTIQRPLCVFSVIFFCFFVDGCIHPFPKRQMWSIQRWSNMMTSYTTAFCVFFEIFFFGGVQSEMEYEAMVTYVMFFFWGFFFGGYTDRDGVWRDGYI